MATKAAQVESALAGYIDASNRPLENGKIYTYEAGTTTPKATYADVDKSQVLPNPIILDGNGKKMIYADGLYKFLIKDKDDNLIDTRDNLQYFYISGSITVASTIIASDSSGISIQDDGGNTGITVKDGGNVGIKGDTNPQSAFGVSDSSNATYASTLSVSTSAYDVVRVRNTHATGDFVALTMEVGASNVGMSRLITKKDSSDETSFYIQLKDSLSSIFTTQQLALTSEGDLTIGNSINVGNLSLSGNTISSISGDLNIIPFAGQDVVIDSHFEFDGNLLTALTDNNTVITAYTGKNITIEDVTFDGGVVAGIGTLTATTANITTGNITTATIGGGTATLTSASITTLTIGSNIYTSGAVSGNLNFDSGTFFIDSSANMVGVGTTSPTTVLQVSGGGTPSSFTTGTVASFLRGASSGNDSYIAIQSGTAGVAGINLGDTVADAVATLKHNNSGNTLSLLNSLYGFTLNSSGKMVIGTYANGTTLGIWAPGNTSIGLTVNNANAVSYLLDTRNLGQGYGPRLAFALTYNSGANTLGAGAISTYMENIPDGSSGDLAHSLVFETASYATGLREVGRFTSSGNMGIGTTSVSSLGTNIITLGIRGLSAARSGGTYLENSDSSIKFAMYGATDESASNPFAFGTLTNHGFRIIANNSEIGRVTADGHFGIGTTKTDAVLSIVTATAPTLSNDTHAGEAIFIRSGGSAGSGNVQAVLAFGKADGSSLRSGAAIASIQTGSDADEIGIAFFTSPSSSSSQTLTEAMRTTHSGNVGIGTATVSARLHAISITEQFRLGYDSSNYAAFLVNSTGGLSITGTGSGKGVTVADTLTVTNQHRCHIYATGGVISTGSEQGVFFDSESFDVGGLHSTSSNTDRITIVESGFYLLVANITIEGNATGYRYIRIESNLAQTYQPGTSAPYNVLTAVVTKYLNAGDYVTVSIYQNSGGNLNIIGGTAASSYFSATKLF